jgi:hypothetical protein
MSHDRSRFSHECKCGVRASRDATPVGAGTARRVSQSHTTVRSRFLILVSCLSDCRYTLAPSTFVPGSAVPANSYIGYALKTKPSRESDPTASLTYSVVYPLEPTCHQHYRGTGTASRGLETRSRLSLRSVASDYGI